MKKRTQFPDPSPEIHVQTTSKPTEFEKHLIDSLFDPLSPDPSENLAGFIIRGVVDVSRYLRTPTDSHELALHYERLVRVTETAISKRITQYCIDGHQDVVIDSLEHISKIDWNLAQHQPLIMRTAPYDGTEAPYQFRVMSSPRIERQQIVA